MRAPSDTRDAARTLRQTMSLPEVLLWRHLRGQAPPFRRQHPVGPYVLDFYCPQAHLAVEVDGQVHDMGDHPGRDQRRTEWLAGHGITVLRILASEILRDAHTVADSLLRRAAVAPP